VLRGRGKEGTCQNLKSVIIEMLDKSVPWLAKFYLFLGGSKMDF